ncbi:MAG TPA: WbqC family protein [Chitinophagaceae bacterium]|nr:WbqC family protein [Chitinophagaceae bacterium]
MQEANDKIQNLIIDNHYFNNVIYTKYLLKSTHINILPFEPYQKMSFRNRCVIAGSNGLINLTVPVENGRNQKCTFKAVRISYREDWQKHHRRTLTSCYSKSAFFDYYRDAVEKFFLKKEEFLFDLNLGILQWLKSVLRFPGEIVVQDEGWQPGNETPVVDVRDKWLPKNFQSAEASELCPVYFQVFEDRIGFQPNLSILDLLFNEGPAASALLMH